MERDMTEITFRRELANAVRFLAIDAVEKAKSGHPGAPMGMADIAEVLWRDHLKHNPTNPAWPDRDRFVLSNGHGSMLLYALLHLTGYDLPLEQLQNFRQLGSKTAGHPEVGHTPGVETTTGPLGQGLANAVGMALAEKLLARRYNRPECAIVDHRTWVFLGDGCLMEGISHEACSLAGVWGLDKLVAFYDDNGISIDGHVEGWFRDDTPARFRAYGWHVVGPVDGHDAAAVGAAIVEAKAAGKPTLIVCRTQIGFGSPNKAGSHDVHGAPLGAEEIAATRGALNWPHAPFEVPEALREAWDARLSGAAAEADWQVRFVAYRKRYPELAAEFERTQAGGLPEKWPEIRKALLAVAAAKDAPVATRKSSQNCLDALVERVPELLGGSADLTGSNLTAGKGSRALHEAGPDAVPNYISYGVREFGMTAAMNGVALHGGLIPYGGTFMVFSDYARNAIRMSALMKQRVVHVLTHDSIGLGEDGPTHQPIEQAASLRVIPGLDVWRPCDELETAVAWSEALERMGSDSGPSALLLSRQNLPQYGGEAGRAEAASRGGYVLSEADGPAQAVIIATGSEVMLAMQAQAALKAQGVPVRVVSMPCTRRFDRQPAKWKNAVLLPDVARVAVEAGQTDIWRKYVGLDGEVLGIDEFGESGPAPALYKHFGLTVENLVQTVLRAVVRSSGSDGDF